jgi:predicted enzyme related to lactoylglutathione lyase
VADADAAIAAVTANGGKALSAIEPTPFGRMAALADPAGAQFKIVEVPAS